MVVPERKCGNGTSGCKKFVSYSTHIHIANSKEEKNSTLITSLFFEGFECQFGNNLLDSISSEVKRINFNALKHERVLQKSRNISRIRH